MNLQNIIKFYNNCYQTDRRGTVITNIFSSSIENLDFFENKDEIVSGFLPYSPVKEKYAEEIVKKLTLAEKEKELVLGSFFIVGNADKDKICSPLLLYPAKIIYIDELPFVQIDKKHRLINTNIFYEIIEENIDFNALYENLYQALLDYDIETGELSKISEVFKKYLPKIKTEEIFAYPSVYSEKELKKQIDKNGNGDFSLIPATCTAIIKKTINTRGIINELTELSELQEFSKPLKTIFRFEQYDELPISLGGYVPTILSQTQNNILKNSTRYPFSVIIGPPGTGKSYTIAALAIEKMSLGKTVLIASGTDKAVDIIADKIETQLKLGHVIVRAGRKQYKTELVEYLDSILQNRLNIDDTTSSKSIKKQIYSTKKQIELLNKKFNKIVKKEKRWGAFLSQKANFTNIFVKIRKKIISFRKKNHQNINQIIGEIQTQSQKLNELTISYISTNYNETLQYTISTKRNEIKMLTKSLRSIRGTKKEKLFETIDFNVILSVFPIWLVKMSDISQVLPFTNELFDYVIIDEATQCDIASSIPIIQRGKKVIITGDPNQLRHFSFLAEAKQRVFRDKFNLNDAELELVDYKNHSLLDLVMNSCKFTEQFHFLDEHYRSLPAIISFSNKQFYKSQLKVMTKRPFLEQNEGIEVISCDGTRLENGTNKEECEYILQQIRIIIEKEQNFSTELCSSIGIISPFSDQADFISKQIMNNLSVNAIQKHKISISTPYGFQGDERDIVFLSFVLDNASNALSFRYLNKTDVFNVSITRARKLQYIVHSLDTKKINIESILRQYIDSFNVELSTVNKDIVKDKFAEEIKIELEKLNFDIWLNFEIAGQTIDIIAANNKQFIGIDLVGFPGLFEDVFGIERYKILARAGIEILAVSYSQWILEKEKCLQEILKNLK